MNENTVISKTNIIYLFISYLVVVLIFTQIKRFVMIKGKTDYGHLAKKYNTRRLPNLFGPRGCFF